MAVKFQTIDEILDFAITQERAAQAFYAQMAEEAAIPETAAYYRRLVEEERGHEEKLCGLRESQLDLPMPDLEDLRKCGYLDAIPLTPEMERQEILRYLIKKEKSAKMLYTVLANSMAKQELADLFNYLASQECEHADNFQREYDACLDVK